MPSKPSLELLTARLRVDIAAGKAYWVDATKHHRLLNGNEAGCATLSRHGKSYWVIRINGVGYKRSHIVYAVATGAWPAQPLDHKDGDSLNDSFVNLRQCTQAENVRNRKPAQKPSGLPMGIRQTGASKFQARIRANNKPITLGTFPTVEAAHAAYTEARQALFGEFA